MKHLNYYEFTELMKNRGKTAVYTDECIYEFTGITEYSVCIQISFKLNKLYQIGKTRIFVKFDRVVTLIEAQSMYMSLKLIKEVI